MLLTIKTPCWNLIQVWRLVMLCSIFMFCLTACGPDKKILVTDFDTPVILVYESMNSTNNVVRLKLELKSNADRLIKITLKSHDQLVRDIYLPAHDEKSVLVDWYSNRAEIIFAGETPENGSVEIDYRFIVI